MFRPVGDAAQQHVFEGDALAGTQRNVAHRVNDFDDRPLVVDGHDLGADRIVGRVEADGELGAQVGRFFCESFDPGNDAGGGDGHAPRAEADLADQQAHRSHEVVVVEERLAHAHEDQIHAIAADANGLTIEDRDDLACDFARGEIALQAEFRGEAELAVDGATDLRGDADGGAGPILFAGANFVAGLAVVTLRHPHGFRRFTLWTRAFEFDQVALGAIGGLEGAGDGRTADLPAFGG